MKAYTDLDQSRKLAEILPLESADMHYAKIRNDEEQDWKVYLSPLPKICATYIENLPCWSLAALLEVIKDNNKIKKSEFDQADFFTYSILGFGYDYKTYEHENLVDACYEMIIKLHEQNVFVI